MLRRLIFLNQCSSLDFCVLISILLRSRCGKDSNKILVFLLLFEMANPLFPWMATPLFLLSAWGRRTGCCARGLTCWNRRAASSPTGSYRYSLPFLIFFFPFPIFLFLSVIFFVSVSVSLLVTFFNLSVFLSFFLIFFYSFSFSFLILSLSFLFFSFLFLFLPLCPVSLSLFLFFRGGYNSFSSLFYFSADVWVMCASVFPLWQK